MKSADRLFFLPEKRHLPLRTEQVRQWYYNLIPEIKKANYTSDNLSLLWDKHNYYGKYLSEDTREFFLNHFSRNLAEAINYFFGNHKSPINFLEIGSGCGNQLLLTAFLGAEVVGCDIRYDVCHLVQRRKVFYEDISGRNLDISLICEDVFKVDWDRWGKFDAINFLFSFNNLQPNREMLQLIDRLLNVGGRVVFQETNQSNYYNRIFRKRDSMLPRELAKGLELYDFRIHSLQGGCAVPPVFWNILPRSITVAVDQILCRSLFMSPSYHLMAEKL